MGPTFLFSRKKKVDSFRNPKLKNGFKIVMPRTKQIMHRKKFFSRNIPPILKTSIWEKIKRYDSIFLDHCPRKASTPPSIRRAVDEGAGRGFPFVHLAQKLRANFVQYYLLTSSRIYAIIIIEVRGNNGWIKKILKNYWQIAKCML